MPKNVTLSIDVEVLAAVRRYAAANDLTLNGLVRDFLAGIAAHQDRAATARRRLRQLSGRSQARIGDALPGRDDLHAR